MTTYTIQVESVLSIGVKLQENRTLTRDEAVAIAAPFAEAHGARAGITWTCTDVERTNYDAAIVYYHGDYGGMQAVER